MRFTSHDHNNVNMCDHWMVPDDPVADELDEHMEFLCHIIVMAVYIPLATCLIQILGSADGHASHISTVLISETLVVLGLVRI